jgi:phage terminase large subunit-like protein
VIRESILQDRDKFNFDTCVYDPYNCEETRQLLQEDGLNCLEFPQTFAHYAPCLSYFERAVINRTIAHNGNQILTWCIGNATTKRDSKGLLMLDKLKSTQRIDLAVCSIMAMREFLIKNEAQEWQGDYCGIF